MGKNRLIRQVCTMLAGCWDFQAKVRWDVKAVRSTFEGGIVYTLKRTDPPERPPFSEFFRSPPVYHAALEPPEKSRRSSVHREP